jgi:diketogulonate reductase-like aldo/keto reductase
MGFILNNGIKVPNIGYGTWKLQNDDSTIEVIKNAISSGYRHFDTAFAYGNEVVVGKGLKESKINRKELFITGKLWNDDRGYQNIIDACKRTINNLGCEYLDLYLVHWPASPALYKDWVEINNETWRAFEYLYEQGLVKAIGVCNFKKHQLEELMKNAKTMPMVNQIEFHPGQMQEETVAFCHSNNIVVEAWSPLGSGKMLKKEALIEMAKKYNKSVAKLCIKWCLQNNVLPLPKSKDKERMKENLLINDFKISEEDMKTLNQLPYIGGSGLDSDTIELFN